MSLDNIVNTVQSLSEEPNKLSEDEEANLYVYLTDKGTKLADVEKLLNLCKTNNAKLVYLKGLSKKSVSEQPVASASTSKKRQYEANYISISGAIYPNQGTLMLSIYERDIFKEVRDGVMQKQSYIIHGPYQSGKTTFLLGFKETLKGEGLNYVHFVMSQMQGDILLNKRQGFFNFMSCALFNERLSEGDTFMRINTIVDPLYILIDEFQFIFTDHELLDAAKHFFRDIASSEIIYVAVGTFILVDLMEHDENFGSPFNKATFKQMPRFSTEEMGTIFRSYQVKLNKDGVPPDLQVEIERESCGHPASFMILLKLFHDFRPTVKQWRIRLQERLVQYMNGTHFKLKDEIKRMSDDERRYVRKLTDHRTDRWEMDLTHLTELNDLDKKLLNIGILFRADSNLVCFTSCIILRVCIEALFPATRKSLPKHVIPEDPIELLVLGLKFIDPSTVIDERVQNQRGPSERTLQAALFRVLNGLLPYPMMCLFEVNASGRTRLDLMIVNSDENLAAYSLKCNKISEADFRDPLNQAKGYADDFDMDIYLVNFILKGHRRPCTLYDISEEIILVNVVFNAEFTQFEIQTQSIGGCQTVNVIGDLNQRENYFQNMLELQDN